MEEASSPRRFRFSLRQLGVLVVFVGMAIAMAMQYRELALLRPEVRKLRNEAGYLKVDDPQKIYAMVIQKYEENTWSWKVHIPEAGEYMLYVKVNDLPADAEVEIPNLPRTPNVADAFRPGGYAFPLDPGEQIVTAALRETDDDQVTMHISAGGGSSTSRFAVASDRWPRRRGYFSRSGKTAVDYGHPPDEPLVLLRLAAGENARDIALRGAAPGETIDGIKIWIERVAN